MNVLWGKMVAAVVGEGNVALVVAVGVGRAKSNHKLSITLQKLRPSHKMKNFKDLKQR